MSKPYLVTCHLMGGLGNQMFQIATTIAAAMDNNAISVFDKLEPEGYKYAERESYWDTVFHNIKTQPLDTKSFKTFKEWWNHTYIPITITSNTIINGYFQTSKYFEKYTDVISTIFKLPIREEKIVNCSLEDLRTKFPGKKLVGMHVRRTDYTKLNWDLKKEYFLNGQTHFDYDKTQFICFSDDPKWCLDNIPGIYLCRQEYDYLDMFLLSKMDGYIISNSSFSWWAVFLGNLSKKKKVVAPDHPWLRNNNYNKDIHEKNWVLI